MLLETFCFIALEFTITGLSEMRLSKLRPLSGRSLTSRSATSPDTCDVEVSTSGISLVTVTSDVSEPT